MVVIFIDRREKTPVVIAARVTTIAQAFPLLVELSSLMTHIYRI